VWNRPISLWQLLHLITPGAWGTRHEFGVRYAGGTPGSHGWTYSGISHDEELRARLGYMTARLTWRDVAPELPPTTRVLEPVSLTAKQYADLEAAAMKATLARGTSNEAQYKATLRRKAGLLKVKPAVERALSAAEDGHKVVLWAWHNEILDKLDEALDAAGGVEHQMLRSAYLVEVREHRVRTFREQPEVKILVASMGVGGVGLDLSCSDCAIFVELDWTPAVVYQAEMRTFHKDRPHSVTYFYTDDPTESALIGVLGVKNGYAATLGLGSDDIMKAVL
jgi:SWI/SNF-related matrix-associated actin-dependent regulator 1 of chromatin subfamily A